MKSSGKIGSALLYAITRPLAFLPLGFHRACGKFLGWLAGSVVGYRRHVVFINLARCFPEKSYDEIKELSKKFYGHLGKIAAEGIWIGGCYNPKRIQKSHFAEITNTQMLNSFAREGKSVYLLTSHLGNWEGLGAFMLFDAPEKLLLKPIDIAVVYKKLSSPSWERFMRKNRCIPVVDREHFTGLVETSEIMRYAIMHKDETRLFFFNTDQYPYGGYKIPINFMGQDTFTMTGGPSLAHKFGMPVAYYAMKEKPDGNYTITLTLITEDASKCEISDIMKQYYELLEKDLREQPWNYLWTHKRWK